MAILTLFWLEGSQSLMVPLLGWVLRATLLLAAAGLASVLLNRRSAALRHLVWSAAFGGVLVLPALGAVLPAWRTPAVALPRVWTDLAMQPPADEPVTAAMPAEPDPIASEGATKPDTECTEKSVACEGTMSDDSAANDSTIASSTVPSAPPAGIPPAALPALGLAIWALGSLLTLTWYVAGHVTVRRLARGALPAAAATWHLLAAQAARSIGFEGACELRVSELTLMPMTWGLLQPRVMLPASSESWPLECRKLVLMHELAHVQRRDCLTQALAQLVCALLWFHPAVWYGARRMRIERERACDDRVLAADTLASTYAEHLLAVVRSLSAPRLTSAGAVPFAHPSQIEGRLLAVLHPGIDRRSVNRAVAGRVLAMAALLALPLAALEPATAGSIAAQRARAAEKAVVTRPGDERAALDERVEWARNEAVTSRQRTYWVGYSIEAAERVRDGVLGDTHDVDFATLEHNYPGPRLIDVLAVNGPQPDAGDPGPVAILLHVKGTHFEIDRVRFQSLRITADLGEDPLYWVGSARDYESVALLRQLRANATDADIAARLLESTALHGSSKLVVPELRTALERGSDAMRAQAVDGLANHPERECVQMLVDAARNDPSQDVREKATEALGVIEAPEALDALVELARSSNDEAVRRAAVEGVGNALAKDATPAPAPIAPMPPEQPAPSEHPVPPVAEQPERVATPMPELVPQAPIAPEPALGKSFRMLSGSNLIIPGRELSEGQVPAPAPVMTPMTPITRHENLKNPRDLENLLDYDVEIQRRAVEALGNLPEEESLPQLLSILEEHPSRAVRLQAIESIANLGGSAAMALLRKFAWQHPDEAVRVQAVQELGSHLPGSKALSQLSEIAEMHPDDVTRQQAVENIGQLESADAVKVLKSIIESDPSDAVQRQAVETLGRRSDAGILDYLAETARTHPSRRVRSEAVNAIGRLDSEEAAIVLDALVKKRKDKF